MAKPKWLSYASINFLNSQMNTQFG
jgi:hypothetical protein